MDSIQKFCNEKKEKPFCAYNQILGNCELINQLIQLFIQFFCQHHNMKYQLICERLFFQISQLKTILANQLKIIRLYVFSLPLDALCSLDCITYSNLRIIFQIFFTQYYLKAQINQYLLSHFNKKELNPQQLSFIAYLSIGISLRRIFIILGYKVEYSSKKFNFLLQHNKFKYIDNFILFSTSLFLGQQKIRFTKTNVDQFFKKQKNPKISSLILRIIQIFYVFRYFAECCI
ncbi:hypothetical protein TTHERM_000348709 (macronuclear) [Tetrahymena thermophila SB210]|uniref:Uncharacterized protein n=1 Tax=Tetrahymena thermophila (strain SB210) TaxID=312017 RepID=W7XEU8_TETTS|nr:hypothetical protein TTHERM_000348709 [Tetrahymena thermophila SB210]EWS72486.1 hypothetical protein TTHERM_000348709 [Tetrahymena thermophila SB210]|eukprot:XP_012654983.1 hypothetical protein TTHERM_000348709 [Tetrahymena thermophila SB210]